VEEDEVPAVLVEGVQDNDSAFNVDIPLVIWDLFGADAAGDVPSVADPGDPAVLRRISHPSGAGEVTERLGG
jgi:hypothetical protein